MTLVAFTYSAHNVNKGHVFVQKVNTTVGQALMHLSMQHTIDPLRIPAGERVHVCHQDGGLGTGPV